MNLPISRCANTQCAVPYLFDEKAILPHLCWACRDQLEAELQDEFVAFDELDPNSPSNC